LLLLLQPPFTADDRKRTMDKIIKAKLVLPAYLTVDARELIRNVSYERISLSTNFYSLNLSNNFQLEIRNFSL